MTISKLTPLALLLFLTACASPSGRTVLDSGVTTSKPNWVTSTKVSWSEGDQMFVKTQYTIRGDERVNGCYQLARIEEKETLVREIAEDIRGRIDSAQQGLSEGAELILSQVHSSEFGGKVTGMRILEQFHERYKASDVERVDCFVLSAVKKTDYDQMKRVILYKVAEADPDLKRAIKERSVQFFTTDAQKSPTTKTDSTAKNDGQ